MIHLNIGTECLDASSCKYKNKCKYHKTHWLHNLQVEFRDFLRHIGINKPKWFYLERDMLWLSGTPLCPFKLNKNKTCYDCIYCYGGNGEFCGSQEKSDLTKRDGLQSTMTYDENWGYKCIFYKEH